jgi:hypothetical protein
MDFRGGIVFRTLPQPGFRLPVQSDGTTKRLVIKINYFFFRAAPAAPAALPTPTPSKRASSALHHPTPSKAASSALHHPNTLLASVICPGPPQHPPSERHLPWTTQHPPRQRHLPCTTQYPPMERHSEPTLAQNLGISWSPRLRNPTPQPDAEIQASQPAFYHRLSRIRTTRRLTPPL